MQVKLFGERNTGTRYLSQLLELNLAVELLEGAPPLWIRSLQRQLPGKEWLRDLYFAATAGSNLSWKHSLPNAQTLRARIGGRPIQVVTLTKNPYAWLVSLYRRPYHQHWKNRPTFSDFLVQPWQTLRREGVGRVAYASPVALWNSKNAAYLELSNSLSALNLTYEALVEDPAGTVALVAQTIGIAWQDETFKNIVASTKKSQLTHADYRAYYASEAWQKDLDAADIVTINRELDGDLVRQFGYELIS